MEYLNDTEEKIKARKTEKRDNGVESYFWVTVYPGKTVELLNPAQAKSLGLTPVKQEKDSEGGELDEKEQAANIESAYKEKLLEINGIGESTAADILELYPTVDELKGAIGRGKKIAVRDDIEAALREAFK